MPDSVLEQLISHPAMRGFMQNHGLLGDPHVNVVDQIRMQNDRGRRDQAVAQGAEYDRDTYKQLFKGMGNLTGIKSTPQTQAAGDTASGLLAKLAPHGVSMFPETWNKLHGSRGSVASLAGDIQDTEPEQNPAVAAQTAGTIFKTVHNPFTGPGTAGLSTAHLGPLYKNLHARGMLGTKGGPNAANSAKQVGEWSGALRAMQDSAVENSIKKSSISLLKEAISSNLIARTLESTRARGALTPQRAQKFEGRLNSWLGHTPAGKFPDEAPGATVPRGARDRFFSGMKQTFDASPKIPQVGFAGGGLRPQIAERVGKVFNAPQPVVNYTPHLDAPVAHYAPGKTPHIDSTSHVAVLGHEMGHVASDPRARKLTNQSGGFLNRLFGRNLSGTSRDQLNRERLANSALRRTANIDDGRALGGAMGVGRVDPTQIADLTNQQLEGYKLLDLQRGVNAKAEAGGVLKPKATRQYGFTTRKILDVLQNPQKTAGALPALIAGGALGLGGGLALNTYAHRSKLRQSVANAPQLPSIPSTTDAKGNWTGFKPMTDDAKQRLFQTSNYVNHPGFWEEAPKKPTLMRMLEEPETAAAARRLGG